jgi:RNA polymerase sigma-70 factor (ECF subfamily)
MHLLGDDELAERAARGDRQAFAQLYERYVAPVVSLMLAKGASRETAWDCAQETFTRALRGLDRGKAPARFDLWIRRIALNVFVDHLRRPHVHRETPTAPDGLPDLAAPVRDHDLAHTMRSLLATMDPSLRDVIILHVYQDLRLEDVAAIVGLPVGTVKSRLHRAYRKLSRALAEADAPPHAAARASRHPQVSAAVLPDPLDERGSGA